MRLQGDDTYLHLEIGRLQTEVARLAAHMPAPEQLAYEDDDPERPTMYVVPAVWAPRSLTVEMVRYARQKHRANNWRIAESHADVPEGERYVSASELLDLALTFGKNPMTFHRR